MSDSNASEFIAIASQVLLEDHKSGVLILSIGVSQAKADANNIEVAAGHPIAHQQNILLVANNVKQGMAAVQQHLPRIYRSGIEDLESDDVSYIDVFHTLENSWGPYSISYLGHDGTSGQGAVIAFWVYETLSAAHRELVQMFLIEVLEVNR